MRASELRPGQFFEWNGSRWLCLDEGTGGKEVMRRGHTAFWLENDFEVNPDCPQCWGEGEEVRETKLPFWQFHSMASRLASMPCEHKSYSQCSETDLCITEWCEPCAAKAWMRQHEQACTPTPAEQKQ